MSDKARRQAIQNVTASAAACVTDRIVSESAQELFGEDVFNLPSMKEFLPPQAYEKLLETVRDRAPRRSNAVRRTGSSRRRIPRLRGFSPKTSS